MELIKLVHVSCVFLSVLFFFSRGLVMIRSPQFVGRLWVRRAAEAIDSVLLLSGLGLVWITGQMPWQEMWLAAKLGLLLVYILLGMVAFHWVDRPIVRFGAWLMAVLTFVMMVLVAMAHRPWPF
ncbi:MAG TPA: SirB2 family protein [Mariprofundaceae bacterium]|nr:SirB2 family protein [Mariprofundaceae bacterium]